MTEGIHRKIPPFFQQLTIFHRKFLTLRPSCLLILSLHVPSWRNGRRARLKIEFQKSVGSSPTGQHIRKNQPDGWFFLCFSGFNEIVSPSFLYILFFALFIQPLINVQGCPCILQRTMGVKVISKMMGGMFQAHPSSFIILIREDIHRIICPV